MAIQNFTIDNATTTSNAVQVRQYKVFGLQMPATITGTSLKFEVSDNKDDGFVAVFDESGTEIDLTVSASRYIGLDAAALEIAAAEWIRIVMDSQSQQTVILMHMKE